MSRKIYIIEKDNNILSALTAKFSLAGLEPVANSIFYHQHDGIIGELASNKPNFIVFNIFTQDEGSWQLLREIKENIYSVNAPIFIYSDSSDQKIEQKCGELGAEYYESKMQLSINDFVEKVTKTIINLEKIKQV